jgi:hypothetical protein
MRQQKPEYLVPALIGGAIAGVLTGIPFINCLCCLWVLAGAALAAHLLAKNTAGPLTSGDGAIVGALAGIVAAIVHALVDIPFRAFNLDVARRILERMSGTFENLPSGWESWLEGSPAGLSVAMFLLGLFIGAAIYAVFGLLGGIIGVSLFGRKNLQAGPVEAPPPPPQGPDHAA